MRDFFVYFFGHGTEPEFSLFTIAHLLPILLMVGAIFLTRRNAARIRRSRHEETLRYILAFTLIICDMSYYWRLVGCPWLGSSQGQKTSPLASVPGL